MRQVINPPLQLGEQDIGAIVLDPKSRDDIPQILRGLQYIYVTPEVREQVFAILAEVIPEGVDGQADVTTGRPGMEQWKILVLGTLRLGLNTDYDRVHELSNEHRTIRQMLGHSDWADDESSRYQLQTIKDNLRLFTPDLLDRINQVMVRAGHALVKKSPDTPLAVRVDLRGRNRRTFPHRDQSAVGCDAQADLDRRRPLHGRWSLRVASKRLSPASVQDIVSAGAASQALDGQGPSGPGRQAGGGTPSLS